MKKGITKVLISLFAALLCVMPFSFRTYADGAEADDLGYIAAAEFFEPYNMYMHNQYYTISCTQGTSLGTAGYCGVYSVSNSGGSNNGTFYNVMYVNSSGFSNPTSYTTSNRFRVTKEPLYIIFLSNVNITSANMSVYPQSGYTVTGERVTNNNQTVMTPNGFYLITLKFVATSYPSSGIVWASLGFPGNNSTMIIPLYKGPQISMPDNLHRVVFGTGQQFNTYDYAVKNAVNSVKTSIDTFKTEAWQMEGRLEQQLTQINDNTADSKSYLYDIRQYTGTIQQLIANGNNGSSSSVSSNDTQNQDLSDSIDNLVDQEDDFNNDMQQNLNNINFQGSDQFLQTGLLSTSAHWVKAQYNRMVSGNVIGSLISYALLFGLGLLIVGKMR